MGTVLVGMADLKCAKNPDILTTLGLGSCVGVTFYDKIRKIGGMAHIMLPASGENLGHNRMKFADTALVDLLEQVTRMGASRSGLVAKIAGGAHMFSGSNNNILKIGERNIAASIELIRKFGIPLIANDTGGKHGRTIELHTETGQLKIKTVGFGEKFI